MSSLANAAWSVVDIRPLRNLLGWARISSMQIGTLSCESKALAYLHDSCDTLSFEPQFATSLRQQKAEKWTPINTSVFR